jgi:hypothetical protein
MLVFRNDRHGMQLFKRELVLAVLKHTFARRTVIERDAGRIKVCSG